MSLPTEKNDRKERPLARGCLDYFPDALAEVAHVSFVGNEFHNPGEPLHWAREKSTDHADCAARHLVERGTIDTDGLRHTAKIAWRALAMLQEELELADKKPVPAPVPAPTKPPTTRVLITPFLPNVDFKYLHRQVGVMRELLTLGCEAVIAGYIARGITFSPVPRSGGDVRWVYLAGPMRGYVDYNFPAFDEVRDEWVKWGWNVISPADIDRAGGIGDVNDPKPFVYRDLFALLLVASHKGSIAMLPGWENSTGACAELALARWLGLKIRNAGTGMLLREDDVECHNLNVNLRNYLNNQKEGEALVDIPDGSIYPIPSSGRCP